MLTKSQKGLKIAKNMVKIGDFDQNKVNAFDTIVSLGAYWFLLRRNKINILDVENERSLEQ